VLPGDKSEGVGEKGVPLSARNGARKKEEKAAKNERVGTFGTGRLLLTEGD